MTKKPKIKITILTEGKIEKSYLQKFKNEHLGDEFVFKFENLKSGNYSEFSTKLEEYRGTENIIFVVVDLDRAVNNTVELENLKQMCQKIKYINEKCNIFLTYENFETFLSAHFDKCSDICQYLNIDKKDIKNDENIYEKIIRNKGKYENTLQNLSKENLCYCKSDFQHTELDTNKISFKQSGLMLLKEYCELLSKKK